YMNSDLPQLRDQLLKNWNELRVIYEKSRDQIQSAKNYYALTERIERFISISEDKIKFWKNRPTSKESTNEIREYYEKCRKDILNDLLVRLVAEGGILFGPEAAVDRTASIQSRVIKVMNEIKELSEEPTERKGDDLSYLLKAKSIASRMKAMKSNGSVMALRGWLNRRLTAPNSNPTDWKVKVTSKNSGLSTESSIKVVKPPVFIEVNESDEDKNLAPSKKAIKVECEVGGIPKPSVNWFLDGIPADKTKVLILEDEQHSLTLPKNDQFGLTKNIDIRLKILTEKYLPHLPSFGSILELKCQVIGIPRPDIYWFKDGRAVNYSDANITSFYDGKEAILMADPFAEGKYAIKAVNTAGEASSSAKVSLEHPKRKPIISTHLKDQTIPKGCHSADLEIDVEGIPKPDLTWYKDGIPFDPKFSGEEVLDKDHHAHRRIA
ncbi:Putative LOC100678104, partial [Caligus rogercresseyi]